MTASPPPPPPVPPTQHSALSTQHSPVPPCQYSALPVPRPQYSPAYAELHCHSSYSLLDGASQPEELVARAQALGLRALALTDHDNLYVAPTFCRLAEAAGLQPIVGAELTLLPGAPFPAGEGHPAPPAAAAARHLTLLAADDTGYRNLCRLISLARWEQPKGEAALDPALLAAHSAGLIALSGCRAGVVAAPLAAGQPDAARAAARWLRELFGPDRCWIELQRHYLPGERALLRAQLALARELEPRRRRHEQRPLPRRARATGCRTCWSASATAPRSTPRTTCGARTPSTTSRTPRRWRGCSPRCPRRCATPWRIAERCTARVQLAAYRFPDFPLPPGETADSYLAARCRRGRAGALRPHRRRGRREAAATSWSLIARHRLAGYFLIVWDLMAFARRERIPAQGRGSAANSIVAYVLGLTNVDPIRHKLFVGRFLNEELSTLPDIDIDFSREHREQVLQYVYTRYGREHAALVSPTSPTRRGARCATWARRWACRPTCSTAWRGAWSTTHSCRAACRRCAAEQPRSPAPAALPGGRRRPTTYLRGPARLSRPARRPGRGACWASCAPRSSISRATCPSTSAAWSSAPCPLVELVPLEPARMPGRVVTQWDKDGVQDSGLIKIDLLSLGMLSLVDEAATLIEARTRPAAGPGRDCRSTTPPSTT